MRLGLDRIAPFRRASRPESRRPLGEVSTSPETGATREMSGTFRALKPKFLKDLRCGPWIEGTAGTACMGVRSGAKRCEAVRSGAKRESVDLGRAVVIQEA